MFTNPEQISKGHETRATAHLKDNNFDEAVRDLREASELTSDSDRKRSLAEQLRSAEWSVTVTSPLLSLTPPNTRPRLDKSMHCFLSRKHETSSMKHIMMMSAVYACHCRGKKQWQERDPQWAIKVLDLPPNIREIPHTRQCDYIKKNFKKLVRKWHPDKAKGDKKRAARKVDEVNQAKKILASQLQCKVRG